MNDDMKMDFSTDIEAARKKRVQSFKLNVDKKSVDNDDALNIFGNISDDGSNNGSDIDTEASAKMMADDFSEKFSLHKYTDADQINNENSSDEVFEGEERAVVDNNDEDPSLEISSFSNTRGFSSSEAIFTLRTVRPSEVVMTKSLVRMYGYLLTVSRGWRIPMFSASSF